MWRFAAAKEIGTSHQRAGLPCQDYFNCKQLDNDSFVFALGDGAGSAEQGKQGAEEVVNTFIQYVSDNIPNYTSDLLALVRVAINTAREKIILLANENNTIPREYASTFLAVIINSHEIVAVQIGDGVIVVKDEAEEVSWDWVFWPQHGEYINTTRFITDDDALKHLQIEMISNTINDLILMTDGLERLALDFSVQQPHDPFFNAMINPLLSSSVIGEDKLISSQLQSFLSSEEITSRTDDDISIIVATRRSSIKI